VQKESSVYFWVVWQSKEANGGCALTFKNPTSPCLKTEESYGDDAMPVFLGILAS
jgi:hypothetical protein